MQLPLSENSKIKVVRCLILSGKAGASLRELAHRCKLAVGSVQLAVSSLTAAGLVVESKTPYRSFYSADLSHPETMALQAYFEVKSKEELGKRAADLSDLARRTLQACDDMFNFANLQRDIAGDS